MVQNWWMRLSPRERWLVGTAAGLAILLSAWLLTRGLAGWRADLESTHRAAVERERRVAMGAILLRQSNKASAGHTTKAVPLAQWLAASALDRGLTLDRNDPRGEGSSAIAVAAAKAPAIMAWLAMLETQGVIVDQLTLTPAPDSTVAMTAELRRRGS